MLGYNAELNHYLIEQSPFLGLSLIDGVWLSARCVVEHGTA